MSWARKAHDAVERYDLEALDELLRSRRADLRAEVDGRTLLQRALGVEAAGHGSTGEWHVDGTALLLARGADPRLPSSDGPTPERLAAATGHWLAQRLFAAWLGGWSPAGDPPEPTDLDWPYDPVMDAVEHDRLDELRALLDSGQGHVHDEYLGVSHLLHALDGERDGATQTGEALHVDTTVLLLSYGADPRRGPHRGTGPGPADYARENNHWLAHALFEAWFSRGPGAPRPR